MQFRALKEALKDSLKNLGFALDSSVGKFSKSVDDKICKLKILLKIVDSLRTLIGIGKVLVLAPVTQ